MPCMGEVISKKILRVFYFYVGVVLLCGCPSLTRAIVLTLRAAVFIYPHKHPITLQTPAQPSSPFFSRDGWTLYLWLIISSIVQRVWHAGWQCSVRIACAFDMAAFTSTVIPTPHFIAGDSCLFDPQSHLPDLAHPASTSVSLPDFTFVVSFHYGFVHFMHFVYCLFLLLLYWITP